MMKDYYPKQSFSVNLDRIVDRVHKLKDLILLNECMGHHPDFRYLEDEDGGERCTILAMGIGNIASYIYSKEWGSVKDTLKKDDMLCRSEVLISDWEEDIINKCLYMRLRVFADAQNPELYQVI